MSTTAIVILAVSAAAAFFAWRSHQSRNQAAAEAQEASLRHAREGDLAVMYEMASKIVAGEDGFDILPHYEPLLHLENSEVAFQQCAASLVAMRTVRTVTAFHGISVRVRIAKGVSYRAGLVESISMPIEQMSEVDAGIVCVTDRRLLFHGPKGNTSVRLNKVVMAYNIDDMVRLDKETGKPLMIKSPYAPVIFAVVQRLLEDRRKGIETPRRYIDLEAERQRLGLPTAA